MTVKRKTGRWLQRFRAQHLRAHPLCVMCKAKGRVTVATEVDHIIALTNGGKDFPDDPGNAQGLCEDCHELKTNADLGYTPKVTTGLDGWPVDESERPRIPRWRRAQG